jgi:Glycosyltransferase family 87
VQLVAPSDTSTTPIQAAAAGIAILTTLILIFGLAKLGKDIRWAALWAWCPTVALEAGNNAHVDVLAVMITALALLVLARTRTRKRTLLGGVLLGLAIATKMTPVLAVPAVLRRRRWVLLAASAVAAVVTVYIPHVIAVGSRVLGYLPGYLQENGYGSGSRFGLLDLLFKDKPATVIAVLVLAVTAYLVLRRGDPDQPWHGAMIMTGIALAVTTPLYQWYALLLVMLVALDGQWEWLGLAAGAYVYAEPSTGSLALPNPQAMGYGLGLALALAGVWIRYRRRPVRPLTPLTPLPVRVPGAIFAQDPLGSSTPPGSTPSPSPEPAGTYATTSAGA